MRRGPGDGAGDTIPCSQSGPAKSHAALCLLYLGYDFPDDFAFCKLAPPVYPELDAFLREPAKSLAASGPYSGEQLQAAITLYLASDPSVIVRGPLLPLEVEQESPAAILRQVAKDGRTDVLRIPFGDQYSEWELFKGLVRAGDLVYGFISEDAAWRVQKRSEGYALIRAGQVVTAILTAARQEDVVCRVPARASKQTPYGVTTNAAFSPSSGSFVSFGWEATVVVGAPFIETWG